MAAQPLTARPLTLLTLKLHLLRNGLRRSPWQVVSLVLALLYGLGIAALAVGGLVALRGSDVGTARAVVVPLGALLTLGWAVVPLVAFGTDATLDPARLLPFPLPARRLVLGLLLAGLAGVPGLTTALLAAGTVVTWSRGPLVAAVAALGGLLGLLTCVALSRLTTTALAGALAGRRSRELAAGVLALVAGVVGPGVALASSALSERELGLGVLQVVATVAGWTPLGWAWSAPADVAAGAVVAGSAKLVLAAGLLAAVLAAWAAALARALVGGGPGRSRRSAGAARHGREPALLIRLERTAAGAVAARALRYWRRDSRYLTALVGLLVVPALLVVLPVVTPLDRGLSALGLGPVVAFFVGWTSHNDVAYDGTAVWLHVSAGVRGWADRWGRSLAVLVWGLPLAAVASVLGAAVAGRWDLLPGLLGVSAAIAGAGQGVSAVASALTPYRVPEPGGNPFATPPGSAVTSLVAQLATSVVILVVASPALALLLATGLVSTPGATAALSWSALLVGTGLGAGALAGGVAGGGRLFDRRGPELLASLAR